MAKEFPVGTIRSWKDGDVIKAHDPIPPYSSGWIPLSSNKELEDIGRWCDRIASEILSHKEPINGERFLDHEIDEWEDPKGIESYSADNFKQYMGYYGAGRYAFRNEFSKRFMSDKMKLDEAIYSEIAAANEELGGNKSLDKLSKEARKEIRERVKSEFKHYNAFTIDNAKSIFGIVDNTLNKIKEAEDIKDPMLRAIYDSMMNRARSFTGEYRNIKTVREDKKDCINTINAAFPDNWGITDSYKTFIDKKFLDYARMYSEEIKNDSIEELKGIFGVTLDMPTAEFYKNISSAINRMSDDDIKDYDDIFKFIVSIRFATQYNKVVEGQWSMKHIAALHNLELAINMLPEGHFLTNEMLELITNKDYNGGSHGGYAWYDVSDKRINFSAGCINTTSAYGQLSNIKEFKSVLFHEIGHAVSQKYGRDSKYDYKKFVVECGWTYESKELRAGMTATGDDKDLPRNGSNSTIKLISDYSAKSPEEAFAEYYSFYCCNKEDVDKYLDTKNPASLKKESQWTSPGVDTISTIGQIFRDRVLPHDDLNMDKFNEVHSKLTEEGHNVDIKLVSPWATTPTPEEEKAISTDYLKMAKDNPIFKPIFSYNDKGKSVVFDGANQVEVNRMNKKMCSAIEISKERYFKLKEAGFSDFDITRCLTTKLAHSTAKKQTEAPRQKLGLYHRNSLIEHTVLESNVHIFTQIRKIFNSDELKKALYDLFNTKDINKSMDLASDMFIKGEISDVQFEGVKSKYEELNQPISKVEEVKQVKIHEQWL